MHHLLSRLWVPAVIRVRFAAVVEARARREHAALGGVDAAGKRIRAHDARERVRRVGGVCVCER